MLGQSHPKYWLHQCLGRNFPTHSHVDMNSRCLHWLGASTELVDLSKSRRPSTCSIADLFTCQLAHWEASFLHFILHPESLHFLKVEELCKFFQENDSAFLVTGFVAGEMAISILVPNALFVALSRNLVRLARNFSTEVTIVLFFCSSAIAEASRNNISV